MNTRHNLCRRQADIYQIHACGLVNTFYHRRENNALEITNTFANAREKEHLPDLTPENASIMQVALNDDRFTFVESWPYDETWKHQRHFLEPFLFFFSGRMDETNNGRTQMNFNDCGDRSRSRFGAHYDDD